MEIESRNIYLYQFVLQFLTTGIVFWYIYESVYCALEII